MHAAIGHGFDTPRVAVLYYGVTVLLYYCIVVLLYESTIVITFQLSPLSVPFSVPLKCEL